MKKVLIITAIVGILLGGNSARAQTTPPMNGGAGGTVMNGGAGGTADQTQTITKLQNPLKANSIQDIIYLLVNIAVYVGGAFAVLAIIYVGFKFVMAQGNPVEINKAKMWLLYIVIGLAILISAKVIVEIVQNTLVESGVVDKSVFTLPN